MPDSVSTNLSKQSTENPLKQEGADFKPAKRTKPVQPAKPKLKLAPSSLFFPTCKLPGGKQSQDYSFEIKASGSPRKTGNGSASYTFSIKRLFLSFGYDQLPDGLELVKTGDDTAEIRGVLTGGGTYVFSVEVTDDQNNRGVQKYSLAIALDLDRYHSYVDQLCVGQDGEAVFSPSQREISAFEPADKDNYPLSLCEFLSYKAAQAYNDADIIARELSHTEKVTQQKFSHFKFFDSTVPMKTGVEKKSGKTSDTSVPERWFEGLEHRRNSSSEPLTRPEKKRLKKIEATRRGIDTQAFGFVFENKAFIISRGTVSLQDWRTDLDTNLTDDVLEKEKLLNRVKRLFGLRRKSVHLTEQERILIGEENLKTGEAGRHVGFATGWAAIRDEVEAWFDAINQAKGGQPYQLVFSGHSLGGALSFVGAHAFAKKGHEIHSVVTFGAPSVGRKKEEVIKSAENARKMKTALILERDAVEKTHFVDEYNDSLNLADRTIRVQAIPDAVPVSLRLHGFTHVGRVWHLHFPPLPQPFAAVRKRWIYGPILMVGRFFLRSDSSVKDVMSSKILSYAMLYGGPFIAALASAHSSESRYAVFLSALSYRKMRAARTGHFLEDISETDEVKKAELAEVYKGGYALAIQDFETHLDFIRGKAFRRTWFGKIVKQKRIRPRMVPHHKKQISLSKTYYGDKNIEFLF